jgi:carbamoyl-phosphate synthase large subunit
MRNASIAVLREIGVETGGSNVQFAINPKNGRLVVIEMNPRVSRSSALASKATGFPIAKIAAKLAVGYTLDELENDITGGATPASFEPTIDYVVTKIPRFAFEKFPGANPLLTTSMKSVGEVMAIGRNFAESLQKALRGLETGLTGVNEVDSRALARATTRTPSALRWARPRRIACSRSPRPCGTAQTPNRSSSPAPLIPGSSTGFSEIVDLEDRVRAHGVPQSPEGSASAQGHGLLGRASGRIVRSVEAAIARMRREMDIHPVYKRIDTCAAEFASSRPTCTRPMSAISPAPCR